MEGHQYEELKSRANDHFRNAEFIEAIELYTTAISQFTLTSNSLSKNININYLKIEFK